MVTRRPARAADRISRRALGRATLARQMLLARARTTPLEALTRLVGLQAQAARPPFVGLWTRLASFERADLLGLVRRKSVVRVTAMRGTLHLMTARDYRAFRGALQPGLTRGFASIAKARRVDLDVPRLIADGREFFGRRPASFDDIRAHLKARYPGSDERALAFAIRCTVPLVQVPDDSPWGFPAVSDFYLADKWLGRPVPADDAPAHALVRRYLAAFGPASVADAQSWSGLAGLRGVFEELRPALVTLRDDDGRELFDLPGAPRPPADTPAPVRFLPDFDNVLLAYDERSRIVAPVHRPRLTTKNLLVPGTVLVDGMVAATWKVTRSRGAASMAIAPFARLGRADRTAARDEGEALLAFLEPDATRREVRFEEQEPR